MKKPVAPPLWGGDHTYESYCSFILMARRATRALLHCLYRCLIPIRLVKNLPRGAGSFAIQDIERFVPAITVEYERTLKPENFTEVPGAKFGLLPRIF